MLLLATLVPFPDSYHLGNDEIVHAAQDESAVAVFEDSAAGRAALIRWANQQLVELLVPFEGLLEAPYTLVLEKEDLLAYGTDDDKPNEHDAGCFVWVTIRRVTCDTVSHSAGNLPVL